LDLLPLGAEEQPRAAEIKDDIREEYHETVRNLEQLDSSSSKKGKGGLRNEDVPGGGAGREVAPLFLLGEGLSPQRQVHGKTPIEETGGMERGFRGGGGRLLG
jgi:hypothetical protein